MIEGRRPRNMRGLVFTTGELAEICGVSVTTVMRWIDTDLLRGYRLPGGKRRRVDRDDLAVFLRSHGIMSQRPDLIETSEK